MVYYDLGNYEKAETNFLIAQKINTEEGFTDLFSLQWNLFNIAKIKVKQGHFDEALTLLDSTSKLCEAKNFKEGMLENYELMAQAYTEQKNYQRATQMYQLIKNLNDSVFNLENTRKVTAAQSMFDAEKKELINRLKLEAEIKQHKWMLWVACLVILIVAGFSGLFFYNYKQKQAIQASLNEINAQQRERLRIAKDIHDDLGSGLSKISLLAQIGKNRFLTIIPAHLPAL